VTQGTKRNADNQSFHRLCKTNVRQPETTHPLNERTGVHFDIPKGDNLSTAFLEPRRPRLGAVDGVAKVGADNGTEE
jgi:hypothetical protein